MTSMFERINIQGNETLKKILNAVEKDEELSSYWKCQNITSIDRLRLNDHGPTHVKIVAENSLKILRLFNGYGFKTSIEEDYNMKYEDAEVVVFLSSIMHDLGMAVHKQEHHMFSELIAARILDGMLEGIYTKAEKVIVSSEILHAIYSHEKEIAPLTLEASVMRVSDALDMTKGRGMIPYKIGSFSIHSISALAIQKVDIVRGTKEKPVVIKVFMNDNAGVFQVNEILKGKIKNTPIENMIRVIAEISINGKNTQKFEI